MGQIEGCRTECMAIAIAVICSGAQPPDRTQRFAGDVRLRTLRNLKLPKVGAPGRIRTCGLWLRRPTLYPAELRALTGSAKSEVRSSKSAETAWVPLRLRTSPFELSFWRARQDSNLRPTDSKSGALSN